VEINLTQLKPGESAIVKTIQGGFGFINKIHCIGIRPGKKIKKVSSHFWGGPQTVEVDNMRVAIGFGMAKRIFVEVKE